MATTSPTDPTLAVVRDGRILVRSHFEHRDLCKSVPGYRWDKARKVWTYPATPEVADRLRATFTAAGGLRVDAAVNELLTQASAATDARALRDRTDLPDLPGSVPAWLHQRQAFHFALGQQATMLAVGMGGGKTKVAIGLLEKWGARRVVVVCPASVVDVWPKEFAGDPDTDKPGHQVRDWQVLALKDGSVAQRTERAREALAGASDRFPVCVVVNYEATIREPFSDWALSEQWDVAVLDESHRIKSPGGVQSQWCGRLRDHADRRLCLTGTPDPHGPLDIYAQARFIDPGHFGTSFARFRQRYAIMGGWQGKQVVGMNPDTADELADKMRRFAYVITKDELDRALDLPEAIDNPWLTATLDAKGARVYSELNEDFTTGVNEGTVSVNNALTQLLRLQQITSGHLPVERDCAACEGLGCAECKTTGFVQTVEHVGDEKRRLLADRLEDLPVDEPVVVFARFLHDLDQIRAVAEAQGRRYGELSGRDKSGLTGRATMSTDVDVLGVQMQSGGVGIDLSRARYAIYYSLGFSLGDYEQSRARVHRPGQTRTTHYDHLIVRDTVDVVVMRALAERKQVVDAVLDAVRNGTLT